MGTFQSSNKPRKDNRDNTSQKKTEIETLLYELNSNPSKDSREFEIIRRQEVDTAQLHTALDKMADNETFKEFDTYNMICEKMPLFVLNKKPIGGEDKSKFDWSFQNQQYYDIYGSDDINDKIKEILIVYFSSDIADVVLQYCGDSALLFSVKTGCDGGMTLSTNTLIIQDALKIYSTYSEKSGRSSRVELSKSYDKKLYMYLVWIVHELSSDQGHRWNRRIFNRIDFNFQSFVAYEILEKPRPPPKETICVVGDCLVLMDCGMKAAKDIRAGDIVKTSNGGLTKVICSVSQRINDIIKICKIGECYITPEHPIRSVGSSEWMIPYNMIDSVDMYVDEINNFVLESDHCIIVDNIECITLGHMFSDPIVKHSVWGTDVVCDFLKSFSSYPDVVIDNTLAVQYLLQKEE